VFVCVCVCVCVCVWCVCVCMLCVCACMWCVYVCECCVCVCVCVWVVYVPCVCVCVWPFELLNTLSNRLQNLVWVLFQLTPLQARNFQISTVCNSNIPYEQTLRLVTISASFYTLENFREIYGAFLKAIFLWNVK